MDGDTPQRLLCTPDAARLVGLSARTLEKHRCFGTGPVYRKLGARVVYDAEDLLAWAAQGSRRSTHDGAAGIVHPAKRIDTSVLEQKGPVRR